MFYAAEPPVRPVLFDEGTDEQKELAKLMVERGWGGTMVLTEPDAGSDVGRAPPRRSTSRAHLSPRRREALHHLR
jgi:alkylation response protein AidB-like acyl-CoA dehydrogenase